MQRFSPFSTAILVSLLIVIAGLVHALKQHAPYAPQINAEKHAHGALKGEENAQAGSPNSPKANEEHGGKHAEQGENEGTEFWPPFLGLRLKITDSLLALFTAGLLIFTGLLWRSTDKLWAAGERQLKLLAETSAAQSRDMSGSISAATEANRISQISLHAVQRPWISEESYPSSDLLWEKDGGRIMISTIIKNVGMTPAQNVNIGVSIHAMTQKRSPESEMIKTVAATEEGFRSNRGIMLFPNSEFRQNTNVTLSRDDINDFLSQWEQSATELRRFVLANVVVCVQYRSTLDKQRARTIRIYDLKRSPEDNGPGSLAIQVDENTPIQRLRLSNFWLPSYAD